MKIRISNIPEEGARFEFSRKGSWLEGILPAEKREDFKLRDIHVDCLARKVRDTVSLEMDIRMLLDLECGRCLEPITLPVQTDVKYTLAPFKERMEEDPESLEEDLNFNYYKGDEIDFDAIVLEQVIMQIPFKPLCKADCKGLCPTCGANLNIESACQCRTETGHVGFSVLKNFVVEKK